MKQSDEMLEHLEPPDENRPTLLVVGRTGSGKSSLINALARMPLCPVGCGAPVTQDPSVFDQKIGDAHLSFVDVPGFGEAGRHEERLETILSFLPSSQGLLLTIGAPDRAWEHETEFIRNVHAALPFFPLFVIGGKIDLLPPARQWTPATLNLAEPASAKENNIRQWGDALKTACRQSDPHFIDDNFFLISAGESFDDAEGQYGLDALRERIVETLPDRLQCEAAMALQVDLKNKKPLAERIIWTAGVAAAAAAAAPLPLADAAALAGIQAGMLVAVARIYGRSISFKEAGAMLAPAATMFLARLGIASLLKIFPGPGSMAAALLNAGVAGPATLAIGYAWLELFARGSFKASKKEVETLVRSQFDRALRQKDALAREAEKNASGKRTRRN